MSRSFAVISGVCAAAVLVGFFVGIYINGPDVDNAAQHRAAMSDVATFTIAIDKFRADCGYYPTSQQGISRPVGAFEGSDVLIKRPAPIPESVWHGPYLEFLGSWKDPWGRPYVYECPGKHNPKAFDIYSLGPNGKGGDEAIGNWPPAKK